MTVRMHRSTDRGAPSLYGAQGRMVDVLQKCLVEGFPTTAVGVNGVNASSGDHTVVTVHVPGHKFMVGQDVTVSGLDEEFCGNVTVTSISTDYITYNKVGTSSYSSGGTAVVAGQVTIGTPTSITRSGTTVTVQLTAHGMAAGARVFMMGANETDYNGWKRIDTVVDADNFTFELASTQTPDSPATGTLVARYGECGLGWTLAFSGTNKSIFRMAAKGSLVRGVLICDETSSTYHTYGAGLAMAEDATALATYTGFPYSTEGLYYTGTLKSGTADTVVRDWVVIGDERTVMILVKPVAGVSYNPLGWMLSYFGDIVSCLPDDQYPILSAPAYRYSNYGFNNPTQVAPYSVSHGYGFAAYSNYAYVLAASDTMRPARMYRNHAGATGNINVNLTSVGGWAYLTSQGAYTGAIGSKPVSYATDAYPDPVHGGINLDKIMVTHGSVAPSSGVAVVRGDLRGLWNPLQRRTQVSTWSSNDTFEGTGGLAGKEFECFDLTGDSSAWCVVEISDTWSQ